MLMNRSQLQPLANATAAGGKLRTRASERRASGRWGRSKPSVNAFDQQQVKTSAGMDGQDGNEHEEDVGGAVLRGRVGGTIGEVGWSVGRREE